MRHCSASFILSTASWKVRSFITGRGLRIGVAGPHTVVAVFLGTYPGRLLVNIIQQGFKTGFQQFPAGFQAVAESRLREQLEVIERTAYTQPGKFVRLAESTPVKVPDGAGVHHAVTDIEIAALGMPGFRVKTQFVDDIPVAEGIQVHLAAPGVGAHVIDGVLHILQGRETRIFKITDPVILRVIVPVGVLHHHGDLPFLPHTARHKMAPGRKILLFSLLVNFPSSP